MKSIKTTIYECEYCGKYYKRRHFAERHEEFCKLNPDNHYECINCMHMDKVNVKLTREIQVAGYDYGISYDEQEHEYSLLKCKKKNVFIIPIISHKKGKNFEPNLLSEIEQIVAPKKCKDSTYYD